MATVPTPSGVFPVQGTVIAINPDGSAISALQSTSDLTTVIAQITSATTTALVSATASQTTRLHRLRLHCAGANVLTFKSASTAVSEVIPFGAGGGDMILDFSERPHMKTVANEALNLTTTTAAQVDLVAEYVKSA